MDSLMIWDLSFLVAFVIFVSIFLRVNRKKINKEGWLLLYHTKWGVKFIERIGKKYEKAIRVSSYLSVALGYILMAGMLWLFGRIVWIYAFHSNLIAAVKIPPIMPLIPYLPQIFHLSWLPPFYFSYWIIILAVIAIFHELFHGIFAAVYDVKTDTTGFGFFPFFFPIFLAAFVNLNEKIMSKRKSFEQRAILSAGTYANLLTAILAILLMWGFFAVAYHPVGVVYDDYAYGVVNMTSISSINGVPINWSTQNFTKFENKTAFNNISAGNQTYVAVKGIAPGGLAALYYDSPAIRNKLSGAITAIDGIQTNSLDKLTGLLSTYTPGENITLTMYNGTSYYNQSIMLKQNPMNESKAWLGITFIDNGQGGLIGKISSLVTSYKAPHVYYEADSATAKYVYNLLWWLVLIAFSVALVNMVPAGIFDGGRFFYLTILSITKSEKKAEKSFKWVTNLLLFALVIVMVFWAKAVFHL